MTARDHKGEIPTTVDIEVVELKLVEGIRVIEIEAIEEIEKRRAKEILER